MLSHPQARYAETMYSHHPDLPCWTLEGYRRLRKDLLGKARNNRDQMGKSPAGGRSFMREKIKEDQRLMAWGRRSFYRTAANI
jgi:hypothetical protein